MSDAPRPGEYEFSDDHKESFRGLATSMSFVGVFTMLLGGVFGPLFALMAFFGGSTAVGIGVAVDAAIYVVMASWMLSAGRSLSTMVRTRGRDIPQLMNAVKQLRRLFGLALVVIILVTFAMIMGFGVLVWCGVLMDKGGRCLGGFG
ncbi:MAG TPA: hypothetical protein VIF09_25540 [Polyangiaceae bacterium]|jgi:hypothetical protein